MAKPILGFSKKTKEEKIHWLSSTYLDKDPSSVAILKQYWNTDSSLQQLHDDFIENTISNFYLPFSIAPNFLINNELLTIPMVIEESSVVAAASNAAKFWLDKGGFKAEVISTIKNGQIHLNYFGNEKLLNRFFSETKETLFKSILEIEKSMKKRGGGLLDIQLISNLEKLEGYYQLHCTFNTKDAMGANFINSCLEQLAATFISESKKFTPFTENAIFPEVALSILSNYVPECLVRAEVQCPIERLTSSKMEGNLFAEKFVRAISIANANPRRAVTHNKGIMNGVDAVILATGNDFRAVEAGVHAFAAKDGEYKSLSHAKIENGMFTFWIEIPLALGTVGGLTSIHPLVKLAFQLLQHPNAQQLMKIVAVAGLAQNFAAIRSLITTGIQKGHMKMHLMNILTQLEATPKEKEKAIFYFSDKIVSTSLVGSFLKHIRH